MLFSLFLYSWFKPHPFPFCPSYLEYKLSGQGTNHICLVDPFAEYGKSFPPPSYSAKLKSAWLKMECNSHEMIEFSRIFLL